MPEPFPRGPATCAALLGATLWFVLGAAPAAAQPAPTAPAAAAPARAAPAVARFDIFEYRIEGNTVLGAEAIERAVMPWLGPARTADDVEQARASLEKAYRDAGYGTVIVDTPEQKVSDAVVVLKVTQGEVTRLRVTGARYYSQGRILAQVPGVAEGTVPNFPKVQEQLASVNRSADRRVTPLLRPGKQLGSTEVDLVVEDKLPLHGSLELNNRYSANTSKPRLQAGLRYDNLWQRDHSVGVQAQVSPARTSEVKVLSGSYTVPFGQDVLVASAIRSNSRTVAGVGTTTVFGRGNIYSLRYVSVLRAAEKASDVLTWGADYKNFTEDVSIDSRFQAPTPVRYMPLSLSYAASRGDARDQWQFGVGVNFLVPGLASESAQFADKRFLARDNFVVLKLDLARTQPLPAGFGLSAKIAAQLSSQPLINNEQYVAGGLDTVRGYLEAAAVGDDAVRASVELRSPEWGGGTAGALTSLRAHAFVDAAHLRLRSPLPEQTSRFTLIGTGVGLRLQAWRHASLALDLGWPLRTLGKTERGNALLHASGVVEF